MLDVLRRKLSRHGDKCTEHRQTVLRLTRVHRRVTHVSTYLNLVCRHHVELFPETSCGTVRSHRQQRKQTGQCSDPQWMPFIIIMPGFEAVSPFFWKKKNLWRFHGENWDEMHMFYEAIYMVQVFASSGKLSLRFGLSFI